MVVICDTLRRILHGARPIDKASIVIELLVLLLIAYELVTDRFHKRKLHHRARRIHRYYVEGQALKKFVPGKVDSEDVAKKWLERLHKWSEKTNQQLLKYSPQASTTFTRTPEPVEVKFFPHLSQYVGILESLTLYERLNNLQAIIENAEVYLEK